MDKHHGLTLKFRGAQHVHRWLPACPCGWTGVPRRRRREAERDYHGHQAQQANAVVMARVLAPRPLGEWPWPEELVDHAV